MNTKDLSDYDVEVGEPYLSKDIGGKYVVLQDETLTNYNTGVIGQLFIYSSEILIDDNPSEAKIFKMVLKGAIRDSWPF